MEILLISEKSGSLCNISVTDPYSGTTLDSYKGNSSASRTLHCLASEYMISAVQGKPIIQLWGLGKQSHTQHRMVCPGTVTSLTSTPDGLYVIAGIAERLHVWQTSTGNLLAVVTRHYQTISCLGVTEDGSHVISGGEDNMVLVWPLIRLLDQSNRSSVSGPEPRHTWSAHSLPVTDIHVGMGGLNCRVATASLDQTVKLWCLTTGSLLCDVMFESSITSVTMDTAEWHMHAGSASGEIYFISLIETPATKERHVTSTEENKKHIFRGHGDRVTCLSVSMDGTVLASGCHDNNVKLWDIASRQCIRNMPYKGAITNVLFMLSPAHMLADESRPPHLPVRKFDRQIFQPTDEDDEGHAPVRTVSVRIRASEPDEEPEVPDALMKEALEHVQSQEAGRPLDGAKVSELEDEVKRLKGVNKKLYQYALDRLSVHSPQGQNDV